MNVFKTASHLRRSEAEEHFVFRKIRSCCCLTHSHKSEYETDFVCYVKMSIIQNYQKYYAQESKTNLVDSMEQKFISQISDERLFQRKYYFAVLRIPFAVSPSNPVRTHLYPSSFPVHGPWRWMPTGVHYLQLFGTSQLHNLPTTCSDRTVTSCAGCVYGETWHSKFSVNFGFIQCLPQSNQQDR